MDPYPFSPIRDPVHNYIYVTEIEQTMLDHPEFQRLRFVLQNSSAYFTYPGNHNNRFLHALGAMHLAGRMFLSALHNTTPDTVRRWLLGTNPLLEELERYYGRREEILPLWRDCLGNASGFQHPLLLPPPESTTNHDLKNWVYDQQDILYQVNVWWQALRLAVLIHDIGHFPLSHVFEQALSQYIEDTPRARSDALVAELKHRKQVYRNDLSLTDDRKYFKSARPERHEFWGLTIAATCYPKSEVMDHTFLKFFIYELSKRLLFVANAPNALDDPRYAALRWLKEIISGQVDADRLDYSLRDPQAGGLELGAIDVQRVLDNTILCYVPAERQKGRKKKQSKKLDEEPHLLFRAKAISALESFFHQRYLTYKYLYYHHNVIRMDGIAARAIVLLLREATSGNSPLSHLLNTFGLWANSHKGVEPATGRETVHFLPLPFEEYDDSWLRVLFIHARRTITMLREPEKAKMEQPELLCLLIDTFLFRETKNVISLWKRDSDYVSSLEGLADFSLEPGRFREEVLKELRKKLAEKGVHVIYRDLEPKILAENEEPVRLLIEANPLKVDDLVKMSPYIEALQKIVRRTPRSQLAFVSKDIKENKELTEYCRETAFSHIRTALEKTV